MNHLSNRLAAKSSHRQVEAIIRADAAANAAERAIDTVWRDILLALRQEHNAWAAQRRILHALRMLPHIARDAVGKSLTRLADWGYRTARRNLARTLPASVVRAVVLTGGQVGESRRWHDTTHVGRRVGATSGKAEEHQFADRATGHLETVVPGRDDSSSRRVLLEDAGLLTLTNAGRTLQAADWMSPFREPAEPAPLQDLLDLLFPIPSLDTLTSIVYAPVAGMTWEQRLTGATRFASPEALASTVLQGYAAGKTQQQIARDLMPVVQNVRTTARRIARTEGLRITHAAQHTAEEGMGEMVLGWQIHATLDEFTRPAHAARNGQIFYKDPGPGQKGLDEMPRPPLEADGSIAWS